MQSTLLKAGKAWKKERAGGRLFLVGEGRWTEVAVEAGLLMQDAYSSLHRWCDQLARKVATPSNIYQTDPKR